MRFSSILAGVQVALALAVLARLARTAGRPALPADAPAEAPGAVAAIVPVLNEAARLGAALAGLRSAGATVREILVVDGGSHDGTAAVARAAAAHDARIRWIDAAPVPAGWNGKAWGLQVGLTASDARATWILTLDADVRPRAALVPTLVAHAQTAGWGALSVATRQELADVVQAIVHPAFLATLVYRFGAPGTATTRSGAVQANGQCFLARRAALVRTQAFEAARASRSEDVTVARVLARAGERVGFIEAGDLVRVRMHDDWRATWREWPRSLTLHDRFTRFTTGPALVALALVQALPLPLAAWLVLRGARGPLRDVNLALALVRLGVTAGMRRAYVDPPPAYWLSPLFDVPALGALFASLVRRRHVWRGRTLVAASAA